MPSRMPAGKRAREGLRDLIKGRLSSQSGRSEPVQPATRLVIEESVQAEARDAPGRDDRKRGGEPAGGCRNGVRGGRLNTAEGFIGYAAPQAAGSDAPFCTRLRGSLKGSSEAPVDLATDMMELAKLDIEDAIRDGNGWLLLSRTRGCFCL